MYAHTHTYTCAATTAAATYWCAGIPHTTTTTVVYCRAEDARPAAGSAALACTLCRVSPAWTAAVLIGQALILRGAGVIFHLIRSRPSTDTSVHIRVRRTYVHTWYITTCPRVYFNNPSLYVLQQRGYGMTQLAFAAAAGIWYNAVGGELLTQSDRADFQGGGLFSFYVILRATS